MTGLEHRAAPPQSATDMLGAIVAQRARRPAPATTDVALLLDSDLVVEGAECSFSFLLAARATAASTSCSARLGLG